jgi:uncharacterized protein (TIGR00290 family)
MAIPVILSWSGGKDSAMAYYTLSLSNQFRVVALLTTITETYQRVSMHGVRVSLLEQQANSLNLPLVKVFIPAECSNEEYEIRMTDILMKCKGMGIGTFAFGDIFLQDIRKYRETQLARLNLNAIFPLWNRTSIDVANEFVQLGFKAVITCVDSQQIDPSFAGSYFDKELLKKLPVMVDKCGENGEFHSFVFDGPIFSYPVAISVGEIVCREGRFYFCELE